MKIINIFNSGKWEFSKEVFLSISTIYWAIVEHVTLDSNNIFKPFVNEIVGVCLLTVAIVINIIFMIYRKTKNLCPFENLADCKRKLSILKQNKQTIALSFLKDIAAHFDLPVEPSNVVNSEEHWRVTAYLCSDSHESIKGSVRYSTNPDYNKLKKNSYSKDNGVIAEIYKNGSAIHKKMPKKPEDWVKYQVENFQFDEKSAQQIRMKSRSMLGFRVRMPAQDTTHVIILVESMKSSQFNGYDKKKLKFTVSNYEEQVKEIFDLFSFKNQGELNYDR